MAKTRKGRALLKTPKHRPKKKVTARNMPVRPLKKKKSTLKNGKAKSKGRTTLHAKGGGNATAAGVSFQASVGAVFAVQMLTESQGDSQLGLPPFQVKSIRFESDAPLDDIVVETDQEGWLLLQANWRPIRVLSWRRSRRDSR